MVRPSVDTSAPVTEGGRASTLWSESVGKLGWSRSAFTLVPARLILPPLSSSDEASTWYPSSSSSPICTV